MQVDHDAASTVKENGVDMVFAFLPPLGSPWPPGWPAVDDIQSFTKAVDELAARAYGGLKSGGSLYLAAKEQRAKNGTLLLLPDIAAEALVRHRFLIRNHIIMPGKNPTLDSYVVMWFAAKSRHYYYDLEATAPGAKPLPSPFGKNPGDMTSSWISADTVRDPVKLETMKRYQRAVNLGATSRVSKADLYESRLPWPRVAPKEFRARWPKPDPQQEGKFEGLVSRADEASVIPPDILHINSIGIDVPPQVITKSILFSCPPNGVVWDPFGNAAIDRMATLLGRKTVGRAHPGNPDT